MNTVSPKVSPVAARLFQLYVDHSDIQIARIIMPLGGYPLQVLRTRNEKVGANSTTRSKIQMAQFEHYNTCHLDSAFDILLSQAM